jgi:D-alanyl-lipoteichoic acid acyltransferase DltB (MBOAT superfamily)
MFLIDRAHQKIANPRIDEFFAFLALAPTFSAGPIDPPSRLLPELAHACRPDAAWLAYGIIRIVVGAVMKFVVADTLPRRTVHFTFDSTSNRKKSCASVLSLIS